MPQNRADLEDHAPAPVGDKVECAGSTILPVAGYGRLRLMVDQGEGNFKGPARKLALEHVAHVPSLGKHNLLHTKWLTRDFDEPMHVYPAAAVIIRRRGSKPLIFLPSDVRMVC